MNGSVGSDGPGDTRRRGVVPVLVHVAQQAADVGGDEVGLERPGRVGVAERQRQVGDAAEHDALVADRLAHIDLGAVDGERQAADQQQVQAGRGDDDVGLDLLARRQPYAALGERVDRVGDERGVSLAQRPEQVAVGDEAETLVPRVVLRTEVGIEREPGGQLALDALAQDSLHETRGAAREVEHAQRQQRVLPPHRFVRGAAREQAAGGGGQRIDRGQRQDVAGRALQHRHVCGGLCHRRHQRHRRRAAADHQHPLAGVVEVLGPVLGMHDAPREALAAGELRREALVVAVVAGAGVEEVAAQAQRSRPCRSARP